MENTNIRFNRAMIVLGILLLIIVELPYNDRSIIQYIIPIITFKSSTSVLQLSGLVPLVGFIWIYSEIVKSKKFKASGCGTFILMFFIIMPFIFSNIDTVKAPIYMINGGVKSVDIRDTSLSIARRDEKYIAILEIELKKYSNNEDLQISLLLPDEANDVFKEGNFIILDKLYIPYGHTMSLNRTFDLELKDGYDIDDLPGFYMTFEDYKILITSGDDEFELIRNDYY